MKATANFETSIAREAAPHGARGAKNTAVVLNVQRMSTEDGPGLRTTVFFKGCGLQCAWCHNPESMCFKPELVWYRSKCLAIGACDASCPEDAIVRRGSEVEIDRELCTACGDCVDACPSTALELQGRSRELDDLVAEVAKDRSYFESSGGGVTVSGGEPVLQAPFVIAFLERCRALGLPTAVDTCGLCATDALLDVAGRTDLVLFDIKEIDSPKHACFTGQPNERILANAKILAERMRAGAGPPTLWIRTPLVPGATLDDDNIAAIGAFIAEHLDDVVSRWELCSFNNLAADKYERLGLSWPFAGVPLMTSDELAHANEVARGSGVDPTIVVATGRSRFSS